MGLDGAARKGLPFHDVVTRAHTQSTVALLKDNKGRQSPSGIIMDACLARLNQASIFYEAKVILPLGVLN